MAYLRAAGVQARCFGTPLGFWQQHMPEGMRLRSRRRSTNIADPNRALGIEQYERATGISMGSPSLTLDEFIEYGLWFQRRAVPDVDPRDAKTVIHDNGTFSVRLVDGEEVRAERVVVAAGICPFPNRPAPFDGLPRGLVSHAVDHDDLSVFAGKDVLVVGAGQSAVESAVLLIEQGARRVELLARASTIRWLANTDGGPDPFPRRPLIRIPLPPTDIGGRVSGWTAAAPDLWRRLPPTRRRWVSERCLLPAASGYLRPGLETATVSLGRTVVRVQADADHVRVVVDDGTERSVDHVLLGTGYKIDITRYPFLAPALASAVRVDQGYPVLGAGLESSVAGLHFLGAAASKSFGPVMRFVVGSWYAAPALTRGVLGRPQPPISFSF